MMEFKAGDRVVVIKNSERIPPEAWIGERGTVLKSAARNCRDYLVEFDYIGVHYIFAEDLAMED